MGLRSRPSLPYSSHHNFDGRSVNYVRNSVKVVIDAYNGTVRFFVFDKQDPIIAAYQQIFPALFEDAGNMPADLRAHVRYPESLVRAQGEMYGLYHTQSPQVFFQREDVWSVANQIGVNAEGKKESRPIDPYYVMMQLPGEQKKNEFVLMTSFYAGKSEQHDWLAGWTL